jgi:hypothetical protein
VYPEHPQNPDQPNPGYVWPRQRPPVPQGPVPHRQPQGPQPGRHYPHQYPQQRAQPYPQGQYPRQHPQPYPQAPQHPQAPQPPPGPWAQGAPPQHGGASGDPWERQPAPGLRQGVLEGAKEGAADAVKDVVLDRLGIPDLSRPQGPPTSWPTPRGPEHRQLIERAQQASKMSGVGVVLGSGLTGAGAQLALAADATAQRVAGAVVLLLGLGLLAMGAVYGVRGANLRHDLRRFDPEIASAHSPVAHLPRGRRAAALGAWIMGLVAALTLGLLGYAVYWLAGMGAYDQPLAAGLISMVLSIPVMFALYAAVSVRDVARCDPAGARTGRGLMSLPAFGAVTIAGDAAKDGELLIASVFGGALVLTLLLAWQMNRIYRTLRGDGAGQAAAAPRQPPARPWPPQPGPPQPGPSQPRGTPPWTTPPAPWSGPPATPPAPPSPAAWPQHRPR